MFQPGGRMQLERLPPELSIPGLNPAVMAAALGPRLTLLWGAAAPTRTLLSMAALLAAPGGGAPPVVRRRHPIRRLLRRPPGPPAHRQAARRDGPAPPLAGLHLLPVGRVDREHHAGWLPALRAGPAQHLLRRERAPARRGAAVERNHRPPQVAGGFRPGDRGGLRTPGAGPGTLGSARPAAAVRRQCLDAARPDRGLRRTTQVVLVPPRRTYGTHASFDHPGLSARAAVADPFSPRSAPGGSAGAGRSAGGCPAAPGRLS